MGEEEATMRERLVEAMARIICRAAHMKQPDVIAHGPDIWRPGELEAKVDAYWPKWASDAETALDAALDMLETPSEEMVAAAPSLGSWAPTGYGSAMEYTPSLFGGPASVWRSMLATLRSPKI